MAILEEISDSEAAEILGRIKSQRRKTEEQDQKAEDRSQEGAPGSRDAGSTLDEVLERVSGVEGSLPRTSSSADLDFAQPSGQERAREGLTADADQARETKGKKPGAGEAVLLGALATGVNGPTWSVIKAVLVALAASLVLLLHVAIQSSSLMVLLNVLFLIIIAGGLALLLSWYVSQIGLVTVEKQMAELNLTDEPSKVGLNKTE